MRTYYDPHAEKDDTVQRDDFLLFDQGSKAASLSKTMNEQHAILINGGGKMQHGTRLDYLNETINQCEQWLAVWTIERATEKKRQEFVDLLTDTQHIIDNEVNPPLDRARGYYDKARAEFLDIRDHVDRGLQIGGKICPFYEENWPKFSDEIMSKSVEELDQFALASTGLSLHQHEQALRRCAPGNRGAMNRFKAAGRY